MGWTDISSPEKISKIDNFVFAWLWKVIKEVITPGKWTDTAGFKNETSLLIF